MSNSKLLKSIIKKTLPDVRPSFGTDPKDPWSAKANIAEENHDLTESESGILGRYLKSRGLNPEFASKEQKIAHSKTGQFIKWKRDHMLESESSLEEAVDKRDTVTFDIPFLIRVMEYAREDAKSDMDLHKVVSKLINIRNKGVLSMKDYNFVVRIRESLELTEQTNVPRDPKEWEKLAQKRSEVWRLKQLKKIDEKEADYGPDYQDKVKSIGVKAKQGPKKTVWVPAKYGKGGQYKVVPVGNIKEYMEPLAATQSPGDGANSPDDVEPMDKGKKLIRMSKSASIIKNVYKNKTMKEEIYDHEKEDKSVASLGKKPKIQKDPGDSTSEKPQAAAIMSGGKTLTGEPRDVIEIDPLVLPRKPDSAKR